MGPWVTDWRMVTISLVGYEYSRVVSNNGLRTGHSSLRRGA